MGIIDEMSKASKRIGEKIGEITNPIVLTILYFSVIGATGLYVRLAGIEQIREKQEGTSNWEKVNIKTDEKSLLRQW